MTTLNDVIETYGEPRAGSCGKSGYIPMKDFNEREPEFRAIMHLHGYRAIYRGPRRYHASMTRRADANFVVMYSV